jgi:hypothetical protein
MWSEGTIGIPDAADKNKYTACHYWVKHYDEPSGSTVSTKARFPNS